LRQRNVALQQAQGDLAAALTSYQAALAIRERLAKADLGVHTKSSGPYMILCPIAHGGRKDEEMIRPKC